MATLFTWILLNMVLPVCLGNRIVLSGSIALDPAKEEINFFLIPFYDLRYAIISSFLIELHL